MNIFRFKTKIPKNRLIKIPKSAELADKRVEIILISDQHKTTKKAAAQKFVDNWAGFLYSSNPENLKTDYLSEKYK